MHSRNSPIQILKEESTTKEVILDKLIEIEKAHHCKILFAVESGSRAWGFPSQDSDYDVRCVYIQHPDFYLSIDDGRDVIEQPIDNQLDINGWDIRKALKLFRKSNPPLLEWLVSGIVYSESYEFRNEMLEIKDQVFSVKASFHHYLSMAKRNFRGYLQGEYVNIKKYFYVLRPVLACKWIEKYNTNPPILFQDLVSDIVSNAQLKREIEELLKRKMVGEELNQERRIDVIHEFIINEFQYLTEFANSCVNELPDSTETLNKLYRKYLKLVWDFG